MSGNFSKEADAEVDRVLSGWSGVITGRFGDRLIMDDPRPIDGPILSVLSDRPRPEVAIGRVEGNNNRRARRAAMSRSRRK